MLGRCCLPGPFPSPALAHTGHGQNHRPALITKPFPGNLKPGAASQRALSFPHAAIRHQMAAPHSPGLARGIKCLLNRPELRKPGFCAEQRFLLSHFPAAQLPHTPLRHGHIPTEPRNGATYPAIPIPTWQKFLPGAIFWKGGGRWAPCPDHPQPPIPTGHGAPSPCGGVRDAAGAAKAEGARGHREHAGTLPPSLGGWMHPPGCAELRESRKKSGVSPAGVRWGRRTE